MGLRFSKSHRFQKFMRVNRNKTNKKRKQINKFHYELNELNRIQENLDNLKICTVEMRNSFKNCKSKMRNQHHIDAH
jgi:hypothetical protein